MYSGSSLQTAWSESVPNLPYTKTNEILPFCCFARKYHRFDICPGAFQLVFFICVKTPSFKHAIYCCPSINNAIQQHFRTYSAKSKEHPSCADITSARNEIAPRRASPDRNEISKSTFDNEMRIQNSNSKFNYQKRKFEFGFGARFQNNSQLKRFSAICINLIYYLRKKSQACICGPRIYYV